MNTRLVFVGLFFLSGIVLMASPVRRTGADWVDRQVADQGSAVRAAGIAGDPARTADWVDRMIAARAAPPMSDDWVDRMIANRSSELAPSLTLQTGVKAARAGAGNAAN